jgi:hypothetical protein
VCGLNFGFGVHQISQYSIRSFFWLSKDLCQPTLSAVVGKSVAAGADQHAGGGEALQYAPEDRPFYDSFD